MFNANEENLVVDENVVEESIGEDAAWPEGGAGEDETDDGWEQETDGLPWWRKRRFMFIAGGFAAVVIVLVIVVMLLSGGDDVDTASGVDGGEVVDSESVGGIEFDVEDVEAAPAAGDVVSLGEAIAVLDEADRVALLQMLGLSEEDAAAVGVLDPWRLNKAAVDIPTGLTPWHRAAIKGGLMRGRESGGGMTLGHVAQDVLASLGAVVWPMVQADQALRRIFTQPLVGWDYWGTQGDLLVLDTYLDAAAVASLDVERSVSEAEFGLSARTRSYVRDTLKGLEPLLRARDIAVEMNEAFADGRGWDTLEPSERSRLGRLAGQEIFEALSDFDRVMMAYGCSVCGELYRNPTGGAPSSAVPASGEGVVDVGV